ncbi:hypothetical protein ACNQFZ_08645 [Schinkia sp. CFF1]
MKRITRIVLIYVLAFMVIIFLRGKTKDIDVTYKETLESFNQYQIVANDFVKNPSKDKLSKVTQYRGDFTDNYYFLIDHQTVYNKLFNIEPILTEQETSFLKKLKSKEQNLDKQYVNTTWREVYVASDFSTLIDKAKQKGEYKFNSIEIKSTNKNLYQISINGTFHADEPPNILRRYFLIETDKGNYYWEKPSDYSMKLSDREVQLTIGKTKYIIMGNIRYEKP